MAADGAVNDGSISDGSISDAVRSDANIADASPIVADAGCTEDCVEVLPGTVSLSNFGGTYPRASVLADESIFLSFDSGDGDNFVLRTAGSGDDGASWSALGNVAVEPNDPDRTLGNAFPLQLPSGRILCAFRHHDKPGGPGDNLIYRLLVSYSDDGGGTWEFLSSIDTNVGNGVWEPFLFLDPEGGLQVYYAREKEGGDQDIVMRRSDDSGTNWGARIVVATQGGSRDGMPAVVALNDDSLLAVFESFRSPGSGTFVVRTVQSNDNGATWPTRKDLYLPAVATRNAGAPHLITLADGRLLASFMTDEDAVETGWPDHASVKVAATIAVPSFASVTWDVPVAVASEPVYWPALVQAPAGDVLVLYDQAGPKLRRLTIH